MRKLKIIIFDDEAIFLHMLKRWFSKKGYEVLTFIEPTGCPIHEKRTDTCMKENPCADIIITGFNMPEVNGNELLHYQAQKVCKIDKRNKAIVSGYMDDKRIKAVHESDYQYFEKPLDFTLISDWLNGCEKRIDLSQPLGSF